MTWQLVVLCIQLLSWTMLLPLCFLGGSILLGLTRRKNKMTREDFLTYFCFLNIFVDENCQEKLEAQVLQPTFTFSIFRNKLIISLISGSKIFFFHFYKKKSYLFCLSLLLNIPCNKCDNPLKIFQCQNFQLIHVMETD